jgi:NADH:ubiquinone oxidoreductase subunit C
MQTEELNALITSWVPDAKPGLSKQYLDLILPVERLNDVMKLLKETRATKMDYLFCLTGADRKDGFHIVYHLTSSEFHHSVVLRVILSDKVNPMIPTVSDIWRSAEYYEREIFDLLGIRFENHPDLRRLFLEDDWIGFPLRKDYKDEFTLER